jgi:toluene monooxygenase system ferredoxin subunit
MSWQRVAAIDDLWDGEMLACLAGAQRVLLVRFEGSVRAYEDRCCHLGVPLSKGELEDGVLTCSAHRWRYDARTGHGINPASAALRSFPVQLSNGQIMVNPEVTQE